MSKLTIVLLGIGLVTIITLSIFTFSQIRKMEERKSIISESVEIPVTSEQKIDEEEEDDKEEELDNTEMIKKAFSEEGSVKCSYYNNQYESESEFYVKDGRIRVDDYPKEDRLTTIVTGKNLYMWAYDYPEEGGIKISIGDNNGEWEELEEQLISDVEMECEYGQIDDSIFDIPDDIEFEELLDTLMNLDTGDFFNSQ